MLADGFRWMADERGEWLCINSKEAHSILETLDQSKQYDVEIKQHRKGRTLSANAYCWVLCGEIAKKIGSTKEEVYRHSIKEIGDYTPLPIKECAVEDFKRIWSAHGIGWVLDVVDDSKLDGYKLCFAYQGSSTYDTKQMARLIDNLIEDAKEVGIEVISESEKALLLEEWNAG